MIYLFIAVLLVLVLMNVFMLLVLRQMARATGKQVEKDAGRLFGMYDSLIEEKSQELQALSEEKERLEAEMPPAGRKEETPVLTALPVGISPSVGESRFQDETFSGAYRRVKKEFSFVPEELAGAVKEAVLETREEKALRQGLSSLSELLSFDNLCRISALSGEQQEALFEELLTPEQKALFRPWRESRSGMDAVAFSDWVKTELARLDTRIVVQIPGEGEKTEEGQREDGIVYEESPALCEGARILYKGRMYDFGI